MQAWRAIWQEALLALWGTGLDIGCLSEKGVEACEELRKSMVDVCRLQGMK